MTTQAVKKNFLRLLCLLTGFFLVQVCCAQKESNTWYFGDGAGLSFNTSPVSILTNGQVNSREGVCSISDKSGSLLFYSDGTKVWDKTQTVMPNGSGLLGDFSSTQSSIVIPNPADPTKYFLFTTALFQGLRYSEIDMTLNGGKGDVVNSSKNFLLIPNNSSSEKVIAVQHCNKKDYWVISHTLFSSEFYVYLINSSGVQAPVIINIGSYVGDGIGWQGTGYLKLSSDGSRLVNNIGPSSTGGGGKTELFNFDNKTGVINGPVISLGPFASPYGAEFSLTNRFLYVSDILDNQIYQFDLTASDVNGSQTTIAASPNISYGALQMGPDARIYVSGENGYTIGYGYLSIIANPEGKGTQCNFLADAIDLNGKKTLIGLPTFAASYLRKDTANINYTSSCVQRNGRFSLSNLKNADSVKWDFGDGSPLSNQLSPAHTYLVAGTFSTKTIIYRSCNTSDTIIKPITVAGAYNASVNASFCDGSVYTLPNGTKVSQAGSYPISFLNAQGCDSIVTTVLTMNPQPMVHLGKDTSLCQGTSFILDAGPGFTSWHWQNGTGSQTLAVSAPGLYWVEVVSASGCTGRDSVVISQGPGMLFSLGKDTSVCTGRNITIGNIVPDAASYLWNTGAVSPQIAVANPGTYWMEVVYNNTGCKYRDTVTVIKNLVLDFTLGPDTAFCKGSSLTLGSIVPGAAYAWNNGNTNPQINISNTGLYWQELNLYGCTRRDSVEIFERQPPAVTAQKSNDIDCSLPAAQLSATGAAQYAWLPAIGLNDAAIPNPVASVDTSTTYFLKGTDNFGCTGFDTITVKVTKAGSKTKFDVANAFTPNGDGNNDCFGISKSGFAGLTEFSIYNRFGQKIFTTNNPGNCWDGRYKGKMQDPGGFVYIIKARSLCGELFRKGIVMLIR